MGIDQIGVCGTEFFVSQPEFLYGAGFEVVDEDIRFRSDLFSYVEVVRVSEI